MILRRLTEHVRAQNWTAVALDFVIVVFGVFIGIQVANWNEERVDRQRETQILRDIATDLAADINAYEVGITSSLIRVETINYIFEETPNAAVSDLMAIDQLSIGASWSKEVEEAVRAGSYTEDFNYEEYAAFAKSSLWASSVLVGNVEPNNSALDALVNSGDLGILRNKAIVRQLQEYRQITSAIEKSQDVTYRPARDAAIAVGQEFGLSAFGTVNEESFLELVGTEPELAAALQSQMGWATGHYLQIASANQSAHTLLRSIQTELGETPTQGGGSNE